MAPTFDTLTAALAASGVDFAEHPGGGITVDLHGETISAHPKAHRAAPRWPFLVARVRGCDAVEWWYSTPAGVVSCVLAMVRRSSPAMAA